MTDTVIPIFDMRDHRYKSMVPSILRACLHDQARRGYAWPATA
jgi:hypothetical protein